MESRTQISVGPLDPPVDFDHFESVRVEITEPIWRVVLARPEKRNAHDLTTFRELHAAFTAAQYSDTCRVVVLAAEGPVFCAGQDLRFMGSASAQERDDYGLLNRATRERIQRNFKPVVAAVQGPAVGGGVFLATACDLVVAVDTAFFQMREVSAGNHSGGAHLFSVGRARSMELNLLGRRVTAQEAAAWGLINAVVPAEGLDAAVESYASELAALPPLAIRYTKAATNLLLDNAGYSSWLDATGPMQRLLMQTPDGREAKAAFREKRPPVFTGRWAE